MQYLLNDLIRLPLSERLSIIEHTIGGLLPVRDDQFQYEKRVRDSVFPPGALVKVNHRTLGPDAYLNSEQLLLNNQ